VQIADHPIDAEYIRLLHDIYADDIDGHSWRGYTILDTRQKNFIKKVENCKNVKRPVCFIFSALESQWSEMGMYSTFNIFDMRKFSNKIKHTFLN